MKIISSIYLPSFNGKFALFWLMLKWIEFLLTDSFFLNAGLKGVDELIKWSYIFEVTHGFWTILYFSCIAAFYHIS